MNTAWRRWSLLAIASLAGALLSVAAAGPAVAGTTEAVMVIGSTSLLLESASFNTSPVGATVTFFLDDASRPIAEELLHVGQAGTRLPDVQIYVSSAGQGTDTLLASPLVSDISVGGPSPSGLISESVTFVTDSETTLCTGANDICVPAGLPTPQLTSSANPATVGTDVTLTATEPTLTGAPDPTGTVSFTDGTAAISGCTGLTLTAGQAACTASSLSAGSHVISAQYSGDGTYAAGTVSLTQVMNPDSDLAISSVADVSAPATSSAGAVVTFTPPTATDEDGESPGVSCDPASGATFPVGTTQVNCTATDSDDTPSSVQTTFQVTVTDADLTMSEPASMTTNATGPSGATVTYSLPTVSDEDGTIIPACSPAPGITFAIGTTTVTCTAADPDDSNSPVTGSFTVTINGAAAQLANLYQAVQGVGPGTSLADKVQQAQSQLASGHVTNACTTLGGFVHEVSAQSGKSIPAAQAGQLIADAQRIEAVLGC